MGVNKHLLPIKFFYLFYYGGISCVVPFIPNYLKQSKGFSPVDVTVVLASARFVAIFTKPLMGHIADKTHNYQLTTLLCLFTGASVTCLFTIIPSVPQSISANFTLLNSSSHMEQYQNHFSDVRFWLLLLCFIVSNSFGLSTSYTLMDALTMKILVFMQRPKEYGRQRMFMTVGIALALLVVSGFMDFLQSSNFLPAFIGFAVCISAASISVSFVDCPPDQNSSRKYGLTRMLPVLGEWRILLFLCMTFVCGLNYGMSQWLMPFYLQVDLDSAKTTVGLAVIVFCSTATVAFYFSGYFINKLGHQSCLACVLVIYALRSTAWSFVQNPWLALATEVLMGVPLGLWLPTMGSYARAIAPRGSEASAQAVLSATFDGFGVGLGSLAAGWLYQNYGGRNTWFIFAIGTYCTVFAFVCISLILKAKSQLGKTAKRTIPNCVEQEMHILHKDTSYV